MAALYPIDTIKTRLQSATHGGGLKALLQRGGGKALYSGVWGNLVGVAPASAIFMAVYNPAKQAILDKASAPAQDGDDASFGMMQDVAARQGRQSGPCYLLLPFLVAVYDPAERAILDKAGPPVWLSPVRTGV